MRVALNPRADGSMLPEYTRSYNVFPRYPFGVSIQLLFLLNFLGGAFMVGGEQVSIQLLFLLNRRTLSVQARYFVSIQLLFLLNCCNTFDRAAY